MKIAGVNGVSATAGIPTEHRDVAPRIGFAFSATPTTVIRGGYGLSYFPGNYTSNADLKNAPFVSVYGPSCQSAVAVHLESSQNGGTLPAGQNPDCSTLVNPTSLQHRRHSASGSPDSSPDRQLVLDHWSYLRSRCVKFRSALIQQFNLQVEQQFGANVFTLGYVGNIGQHLPETINNINQPLPYNPFAPVGSATNP